MFMLGEVVVPGSFAVLWTAAVVGGVVVGLDWATVLLIGY